MEGTDAVQHLALIPFSISSLGDKESAKVTGTKDISEHKAASLHFPTGNRQVSVRPAGLPFIG